MTNNDMVSLFPDVIQCLKVEDMEIRKLCFLYLVTYAKIRPSLVLEAVPTLTQDLKDPSPLTRALALRTMSSIPVVEVFTQALEAVSRMIHDEDPYVRKSAAINVAKLWSLDRSKTEARGLVEQLRAILGLTGSSADENPTVVAAAATALTDIWSRSPSEQIVLDYTSASELASLLPLCNEWSQISLLKLLMFFVPQVESHAVRLISLVVPRLQHANTSVVLNTTRLIVYLSNYVRDLSSHVSNLQHKLGQAFTIMMDKRPEIQFLVLRSCHVLLSSRPHLFSLNIRVFFCKYNDPIYIKSTKIGILCLLASEDNIDIVLQELKDYSTDGDADRARLACRAIGELALRLESVSPACVTRLMELYESGIPHIIQEVLVLMKDIVRRYPGTYDHMVPQLCHSLDLTQSEPESKAAAIWLLGQYADRVTDSLELLQGFSDVFLDENFKVQLAYLTAVMKLFVSQPTRSKALVPKVLELATERANDPEIRDKGFMYWRLLAFDAEAAKRIIVSPLVPLKPRQQDLPLDLLKDLELNLGSISAIHMKACRKIFSNARPPTIVTSPALVPRDEQGGQFKPRPIENNVESKPALSRLRTVRRKNSLGNLLTPHMLADSNPSNNLNELVTDFGSYAPFHSKEANNNSSVYNRSMTTSGDLI